MQESIPVATVMSIISELSIQEDKNKIKIEKINTIIFFISLSPLFFTYINYTLLNKKMSFIVKKSAFFVILYYKKPFFLEYNINNMI